MPSNPVLEDMSARPAAAPTPLRAPWLLLNLLQLVFTLLWTAGCITAALLVRAVRGRVEAPLRMASRLWAPGLLHGAGARLVVRGAEAVDWSRPYVIVANHESMIDICALFRAVPVPLRFVMKGEMARVPFLGRYTRAMGMVFVEREARGAGEAMLRDTAALLRGGACVLVFPEGTRSRDGRMAAFKSGAFRAAIEAGVEVLPVGIAGAGAVLSPVGLFRVRPGRIVLRFGTPLAAVGADRQTLAATAHAAVLGLREDAQREA